MRLREEAMVTYGDFMSGWTTPQRPHVPVDRLLTYGESTLYVTSVALDVVCQQSHLLQPSDYYISVT